MGSNSEGRLGIGNTTIRQSSSPCLVEDLIRFNCVQISCGWGHTVAVMGESIPIPIINSYLFLADNGEAYSWGVGEYGALGIGTTDSEWSPAKISLEGKPSARIVKVSCGSRHTGIISGKPAVFSRIIS